MKENIFENINPETSYWAGFLMGDGNIYIPSENQNPRIQIGLGVKDLEHLEKFREFVNSNNKISFNEKQGCVYLSITSKKMAKDLARWGVVPKKSKIAIIKPHLKRNTDFWRGLIDADGSIGLYNSTNNGARLSFSGSEDTVRNFCLFSAEITNTRTKPRKVKKYHYHFQLNHRKAAKMIFHLYCHERPFCFLERKMDIANKVVEFYAEKAKFRGQMEFNKGAR